MPVDAAVPVPRRVFVSGANGFIGRALLHRYRQLGAAVCGMDVRADPAWDVVAGDLGAPGPWQAHARGSDLVVNTAAVVSNVAAPALYRRISVAGVRHMIDAAVAGGAQRVLHVSSCGAYGWHHTDEADERAPITVLSGSSYQDAKAASEHPLLAAHAAGEIAGTIVRPSDVYGPGSRPWVLLPLEMIRAGRFLLPAHGRGLLNPVYVDDLVDGIVRAAGLAAGAGHIFNLSGGQPVATAEFFAHHVRWAGRVGAPRCVSTATAVRLTRLMQLAGRLRGRPNEASPQTMLMLSKQAGVSIEKARRRLGYAPRVALADGMRRTEDWLRAAGLLAAAGRGAVSTAAPPSAGRR